MDDLVKRLHQWGCFGYGHEASKTMHEAADRIEALEAALREIRGVASQYGVKSGPACAMRNIARAALAGEKKE